MKKAFLDTSSLIKLYHYEADTDAVNDALSKGVGEMFLSETSILEFRSAMWKKYRKSEIDENTALGSISCFQDDYNLFQWITLSSEIIQSASGLLMKYGKQGLRTLDSLQFASALTLKDEDCIFLTSDNLLKSLFEKENLKVV